LAVYLATPILPHCSTPTCMMTCTLDVPPGSTVPCMNVYQAEERGVRHCGATIQSGNPRNRIPNDEPCPLLTPWPLTAHPSTLTELGLTMYFFGVVVFTYKRGERSVRKMQETGEGSTSTRRREETTPSCTHLERYPISSGVVHAYIGGQLLVDLDCREKQRKQRVGWERQALLCCSVAVVALSRGSEWLTGGPYIETSCPRG
jgi:hypothetical protein